MSWFSQWAHPGRGYKKAGKEEQRNFNEAQNIRKPVMDRGDEAYKGYNDMYQKLMHPEELQSEWASHYEKSPYATQLQQEAMGQGLDAASASGLNGSSAAIHNIEKGGADIMQKDRQQYMNDMMQKYLAAMGIGQDLNSQGNNMRSQSATGQQQHGEWQANNKFNEYNAGGNRFGDIMSQAAAIAASMAGGGMGYGFNMPGFDSMSSDMYGGS